MHQVPMRLPSSRRITTVAERGRPPDGLSGHTLTACGFKGSLRSLEVSR
jgi:hypothetical protein